jgi:hypothetical protein
MGRASRRRAERRAAPCLEPVFRVTAPSRRQPVRSISGSAREGLLRLAELRGQQLELEREMERQALQAVAAGASWAAVGRALGISRQGARQRYG